MVAAGAQLSPRGRKSKIFIPGPQNTTVAVLHRPCHNALYNKFWQNINNFFLIYSNRGFNDKEHRYFSRVPNRVKNVFFELVRMGFYNPDAISGVEEFLVFELLGWSWKISKTAPVKIYLSFSRSAQYLENQKFFRARSCVWVIKTHPN